MSASRPAASAPPISRPSRWPSAAPGRWRCSTSTASTRRMSREYARLAKTEAGFREYLDRYVFAAAAARPRNEHRAGGTPARATLARLILRPVGAAGAAHRGRRGLAHPAPRPAGWCEAGPSGAAVAAAQAQRQSLHRGLARVVRPDGPGADRPVLPRRRADRRRRPTSTWSAPASGRARACASPGSFGSAFMYFMTPAHHPVPRGAFAARAGDARGQRLRPRRLAARRVPPRHGAGAGDGALRVPLPSATARASRWTACIPARAWRASAQRPASTSTRADAVPETPDPTAGGTRAAARPGLRRDAGNLSRILRPRVRDRKQAA